MKSKDTVLCITIYHEKPTELLEVSLMALDRKTYKYKRIGNEVVIKVKK